MRSIDKGMLLAEYFSMDTSKEVSSFILWVKKSENYREFNRKIYEYSKMKSLKGNRLFKYASTINIEDSLTMEEAIINYGKMMYFLKVADEEYYVNPLIIKVRDENTMRIGEIKIDFDGNILTLNEISKLEGYSFEFKSEFVKKAIDEWMSEVNVYLIGPLKMMKADKSFFKDRKIIIFPRVLEYLLIALVGVSLFFVYNSSLKILITSKSNVPLGLSFYFTMSVSALYLLELVIITLTRIRLYHRYRKYFHIISKDIDSKVVDSRNHIYEYIMKAMGDNSSLDEKITSFNSLSKLNDAIFYFSKRYEQNKKMPKNRIRLEEKVSFIIYLVVIIIFMILTFNAMG